MIKTTFMCFIVNREMFESSKIIWKRGNTFQNDVNIARDKAGLCFIPFSVTCGDLKFKRFYYLGKNYKEIKLFKNLSSVAEVYLFNVTAFYS